MWMSRDKGLDGEDQMRLAEVSAGGNAKGFRETWCFPGQEENCILAGLTG
jgi:hypothetical protein